MQYLENALELGGPSIFEVVFEEPPEGRSWELPEQVSIKYRITRLSKLKVEWRAENDASREEVFRENTTTGKRGQQHKHMSLGGGVVHTTYVPKDICKRHMESEGQVFDREEGYKARLGDVEQMEASVRRARNLVAVVCVVGTLVAGMVVS